ncbi:hypothetical protein ABMA28_014823 [Loxostege sticticalis]|uniref:Cathepsin propeptide inhibitor domain-containing protein n=1 Tax=Loxostege sticticalis TaxID=481309 RepID=A0ABD0TCE6_LOXSC
MKVIGVILFICLLVNWIQGYYSGSLKKTYYDLNDAPRLFDKFIKDYNRHYKDYGEYLKRYSIFVRHLQEINIENLLSTTATFGINSFADMTPEEEKQYIM